MELCFVQFWVVRGRKKSLILTVVNFMITACCGCCVILHVDDAV